MNRTQALRHQLTLEANRWPFFGVECLVHFLAQREARAPLLAGARVDHGVRVVIA
jgi:hypothetical protein